MKEWEIEGRVRWVLLEVLGVCLMFNELDNVDSEGCSIWCFYYDVVFYFLIDDVELLYV